MAWGDSDYYLGGDGKCGYCFIRQSLCECRDGDEDLEEEDDE